MNQKGIASARTGDPVTSYSAAEDVERSGKAASQREKCLDVVRSFPGRTAAEVAYIARLERHTPSRRLPELRERGQVENGTRRICQVTCRQNMTWWFVKTEGS